MLVSFLELNRSLMTMEKLLQYNCDTEKDKPVLKEIIICGKTPLHHSVHEQTIISRQLLGGGGDRGV